MRQGLQCARAKIDANIAEFGNRAGAEQHRGGFQPLDLGAKDGIVPDVIEDEAACGCAMALEEILEDGPLHPETGEDRCFMQYGMIHQQFVVPQQHRAMQCAAAATDALENFTILFAIQFQASNEARDGLRTIHQGPRGRGQSAPARRVLPDFPVVASFCSIR